MRKIKFRGKRVDNGEWVYGYYTIGTPIHHYITNNTDVRRILPETVGQFTGLFSKSGVEVYEGDLVIFPQLSIITQKPIVVEWESSQWKYLNIHTNGKYEIEVIGNIHENK